MVNGSSAQGALSRKAGSILGNLTVVLVAPCTVATVKSCAGTWLLRFSQRRLSETLRKCCLKKQNFKIFFILKEWLSSALTVLNLQ